MENRWKVNDNRIMAFLLIAIFVSMVAAYDLTCRYELSTENQELKSSLHAASTSERILQLSREFGFSPGIVEPVVIQSRIQFKANQCGECKTWVMIKSPDDLAKLMLLIINVESGGDPEAFNAQGKAYGLTQLKLGTAQDYDPKVTPRQLLDPHKNIEIATKHLIVLLKRYEGEVGFAVIAWNKGMGAVDKSVAFGTQTGVDYLRKVLYR